MEAVKLTVEQVEFAGWKLTMAVNVTGKYDSRVRNPKVTVIFDSGTQQRRVPLLVRSYTEKHGNYLVYAQYSYDVRHIFYNEAPGKKITISFDVMYGEEFLERVPFTLGEMANQKYDSGDDSEEEGSSEENLEEEDDGDDGRNYYDVEILGEQGQILCLPRFEVQEESLSHRFKKNFRGFVKRLWRFTEFLIALCLLPVFFMDAILASVGCAPRKSKIRASNPVIYIIKHARWRVTSFCHTNIGLLPCKLSCMKIMNGVTSLFPVKKNRIVFMSNRREDLSGNFEFVYDLIKDDKSLDIRFMLDSHDVRHMKFSNMLRLARYFANARVILVDDYMELLFRMPRRKGTVLIQLWHACGAFKTFGCSRLGKKGGQTLKSPNHRSYDYATVSSKEIAKFYAEGFGLSPEKVVATGVPRTDIFFDEAYKKKVQEEFYSQYPKLRDKKILLFAPTFRGNGKNSGYYPVELFDVNKLYEALGEEYAIVIKHHPFVQNRNPIQKKYREQIIDLSQNSELNDLLFVTDVLVTDYSSVVFEASLLKIPMLFYVFDLEQYIATRGFYYEYETFVPGRIVYHFEELAEAIQANELGQEKLEGFRDRFFDDKDGKSTQRTVDLIYKNMQEK